MDEFKVEFHLTLNEVNLILNALSELPYKVSFELIQKIKLHGEEQFASFQKQSEESKSIGLVSAKRLWMIDFVPSTGVF